MALFRAVVWIDHQSAQVLQCDAKHVQASKAKAHSHHTAQHGSAVRAQHEFFADVCDALAGIPEVLVAGPHQAQANFRHYVAKHRSALLPHLMAWETVAHPTENQEVALARKVFLKVDRMAGTPTPG